MLLNRDTLQISFLFSYIFFFPPCNFLNWNCKMQLTTQKKSFLLNILEPCVFNKNNNRIKFNISFPATTTKLLYTLLTINIPNCGKKKRKKLQRKKNLSTTITWTLTWRSRSLSLSSSKTRKIFIRSCTSETVTSLCTVTQCHSIPICVFAMQSSRVVPCCWHWRQSDTFLMFKFSLCTLFNLGKGLQSSFEFVMC